MFDKDIRLILKDTILKNHYDDTSTKVVEELTLPVTGTRIDIAVFNGHSHGFEIKSASDKLSRLPNQLVGYSYIFDFLTIATETKYLNEVLKLAPKWVEVIVCCEETKSIKFVAQKGKRNKRKKGFYIARLLLLDELKSVLIENNLPLNRKLTSWGICQFIADNIETEKLSEIVRNKLKKRKNWKNS